MSFRLHPGKPFGPQVRHLTESQLSSAIEGLSAPGVDGVERTVHDVRKRLKRVRGLLRLARPAMNGGYRRANADLRDAARDLSSLRDAHALLGTFEQLVTASHVGRVDRPAVEAVRGNLAVRVSRAAGEEAVDRRLRRAADLLEGVRARVGDWEFDEDPSLVVAGAVDTYRRGRRAFRSAAGDPSDAGLHEWRKRAKYGWQQARVLRSLAPSVLEPLAVSLTELSDALGDDHDLAVLRSTLDRRSDDLIAAIDAVRADLQDRSLRLGARVYAERPRAFGRRIDGYRAAWDDFGPERTTGEIADLVTEAADRPPHVDA